jgi:pyrimidine-specific ribonucleoside hydrolase
MPSSKSTMKKIFLLLLIACSFLPVLSSQPRPVALSSKIIIDTDCASDDLRAISLILSQPGISILGFLTSDGSVEPIEGARKVRSLLETFGKKDIPVATGSVLRGNDPAWRSFNTRLSWGKPEKTYASNAKSVSLLKDILTSQNEKVSLVCLGPLTNIANLIREDKSLMKRIDRIIWYNDSVSPLEGYNYDADRISADLVLESDVRIDIISNLGKSNAVFDNWLFTVCKSSHTKAATILTAVFNDTEARKKLNEGHFRLYDDLVAIYLFNPELFNINVNTADLNIRYCTDYSAENVKEVFKDMITGEYFSDNSIVFNRFPSEKNHFKYDVRPIIDSAISRYGYEEWKANVMTDEFHGHLGVFSIVGAKMGIKAREIFGVGPDMLEVVSYAGVKPPYSCLNDGIQASTGATVGMGTIHLAADSIARPVAVFTYKNHSVKISLKDEYLKKVDEDINQGIIKFGLSDDGYWKLIRQNALKYWLEWSRNEIFDIVESEKPLNILTGY